MERRCNLNNPKYLIPIYGFFQYTKRLPRELESLSQEHIDGLKRLESREDIIEELHKTRRELTFNLIKGLSNEILLATYAMSSLIAFFHYAGN